MRKTIYTPELEALRRALTRIRTDAGMRQSDLAARLGKPQSFVSKYESGQRRLDLLEIREICETVGIPLEDFVRLLETFLREKP